MMPGQQEPRMPVRSEHYTISDLAREFDITTRAIRFYEEKGLLRPLRRGQQRIFSAADRVRLMLILRGKRIGLTLDESSEIIAMYDPVHGNVSQYRKLLEKIERQRARFRRQQTDIENTLALLDEVQQRVEAAMAGGAADGTGH